MPVKAKIIRSPGQYIYIPASSKERFLTSPAAPESFFANHDVRWAGLSNLTADYRVERQDMINPLMLYTLNGSGQLQIKGQPARTLCRDDLFIAPYNSAYSYWTDQKWDIMWIHFNQDSKWKQFIGTQPRVQKAAWTEELHREMEACLKEIHRRWADSGSALHFHINLIVLYLQRELGQKNPMFAESRRILEDVWNEVQLHINRKWTVEKLAKLANMSKSGFQRTVKEQTGSSAMQVVNTMRMENASAMLLYTDYTLDTIAATVGYEDQFAFSKAFKRYAGLSPGRFKLQNNSPK